MGGRLLVVDDDQHLSGFFEDWLARRGFAVQLASSLDALDILAQAPFEAVLAEVDLSWGDGIELCSQVADCAPGTPVVLIGQAPDFAAAVAALRVGAFDYLLRPLDLEQLEATLRRAVRHRVVNAAVERLRTTTPRRCCQLIGDSLPMQQLYDLIERVAPTDVSVLITGETGTGKELVAAAIHQCSRRSVQPLVEVDCAAMPEQLLESELFGHVRGAFTDAKSSHTGLLVHAQGGTVFLDEIGDMPAGLQPKLLRVLQQRMVRPVGSTSAVPVDVRVVAATHRDLEHEVRQARFRHDLFFRINVVQLHLPPLRERGEDILLLAQSFVRELGAEVDKGIRGLSPEAAESLLAYPWPGNVRELRNCMERAVALTRHVLITRADLPQRLQEHRRPTPVPTVTGGPTLPTMEEIEQQHISRVLERVRGNKTLAARILGFDRKTLYRKLDRYGIGQLP